MGSWGDLFATIGLAKAVAARGHAVRVATTSAYASMVEDEDLRFVPTGPRFGPVEFAAEPSGPDPQRAHVAQPNCGEASRRPRGPSGVPGRLADGALEHSPVV